MIVYDCFDEIEATEHSSEAYRVVRRWLMTPDNTQLAIEQLLEQFMIAYPHGKIDESADLEAVGDISTCISCAVM
jgi:hypothetical protein